jgi:PPOX class probable F420-dependent enzyme
MANSIPSEIRGQNYISLATFRKNGVGVYTPVWFAEDNGKLYVMTSAATGKYKRIRNNGQVKIAPCTIRGTITGPEFPATARILPAGDGPQARNLIRAKYWMARIPLIWQKSNVYIEITVS